MCVACATCADGTVTTTACTSTTDTVCAPCDPSCLTCTGPASNQCASCSPTEQLVGGECESLCGTAPDPACQVAAKAKLQSNEKTAGKEKLKLLWKKVAGATSRTAFGDPVTGGTVAVLCIFDDGDTLIREFAIDRGSQPCGTKPCWKLSGKRGFLYKDKSGSAGGIVKIGFVGGDPDKGNAGAQGQNNPKKGLTELPAGIAAELGGNTMPTIELVTSGGLCIGARMNDVQKDDSAQYKAQKK